MTAPQWRDRVRAMLNCAEAGLQIDKMVLAYDDRKGRQLSVDLMDEEWDAVQKYFSDGSNSRFEVQVELRIREEDEDDVMEFDEVPLAVQDMIDMVDGDVYEKNSPIFTGDALEALYSAVTKAVGRKEDIHQPPDPLADFKGDKNAMLAFYEGYDVSTQEGRLAWSKGPLARVYSKAISPKAVRPDAIQVDDAALRKAVEESKKLGEEAGYSLPDLEDAPEDDDDDYYAYTGAYDGTQAQHGPPIDVCLRFLDAQPTEDEGKYSLTLLAGKTKRTFYHYQISAALGSVARMCGGIPTDKLPDYLKAKATFAADLEYFNTIRVGGGMLCDGTGLGKTITFLLTLMLLKELSPDRDSAGESRYRPTLLLAPPILLQQWADEIVKYWSGFFLVISYGIKEDFYSSLDKQRVSSTDMRSLKQAGAEQCSKEFPGHLAFIWDKKNDNAASTILLSSYESHAGRTTFKTVKKTPGQLWDPTRCDAQGKELYRIAPTESTIFETFLRDRFRVVLCDEAQKIKNASTRNARAVSLLRAEHVLLGTATPISNRLEDFVGLMQQLWPGIKASLAHHGNNDPEIIKWFQEIPPSRTSLLDEVLKLPPQDPRRLYALRPSVVETVVAAESKVEVARYFHLFMDAVVIRRTQATELRLTSGATISLRGLMKKAIRQTVMLPRTTAEQIEYELWHRIGAREYVEELRKPRDKLKGAEKLRYPVAAQRYLDIANTALPLARLNHYLRSASSSTHVAKLTQWRAAGGSDADWIVQLTRRPGDPKVDTAAGLVEYLCYGAPELRYLIQLSVRKGINAPINAAKWKAHQKLLVGEVVPVAAWYTNVVLRAALLDSNVLSGSLAPTAKFELSKLFNKAEDPLRILILPYAVSAAGLNFHVGCSLLYLKEVPPSPGIEVQAEGRPWRINSRFKTLIIRKEKPNSHDAFRSFRLEEKSANVLATNAHDPAVKSALVRCLQDFQPTIDRAHQNPDKSRLLKLFSAPEHADWQEELADKHEHDGAKTARDKLDLTMAIADILPDAAEIKRAKKEVEVFKDGDFDPKTGRKLTKEAIAKKKAPLDKGTVCEELTCQKPIKPSDDAATCQACFKKYHLRCTGMDDAEFILYDDGNEWFCDDDCRRAGTQDADDDDDDYAQTSSDDDDELNEELDDELGDGASSSTSSAGRARKRQKLRSATPTAEDDEEGVIPLLTGASFKSFRSEEQPSDEERELLALVSLKPGKQWAESDLDDEEYFRIALRLLWNRVHGKGGLKLTASIHIKYSHVKSQAFRAMKSRVTLTNEDVEELKKDKRVSGKTAA